MVAAGLNPRTTSAHAVGRRVATLEKLDRKPSFNRRSATADACSSANRGLKPTAAFISSLRDEVISAAPDSGRASFRFFRMHWDQERARKIESAAGRRTPKPGGSSD